jgi:hypothetical protein
MNTKHTPGPWAVVHSSEGYSVGAQHKPGCFPKTRLCDMVTGTQQDAELIAAAPELLAALKRLIDCPATNLDDLEPEDCEAILQAERAIAKAIQS